MSRTPATSRTRRRGKPRSALVSSPDFSPVRVVHVSVFPASASATVPKTRVTSSGRSTNGFRFPAPRTPRRSARAPTPPPPTTRVPPQQIAEPPEGVMRVRSRLVRRRRIRASLDTRYASCASLRSYVSSSSPSYRSAMYSIARATKPFMFEGAARSPDGRRADVADDAAEVATGVSHVRPSDHAVDHSAHSASSASRICENTRFPRAELSAACDGTSACMSTRGASYGSPDDLAHAVTLRPEMLSVPNARVSLEGATLRRGPAVSQPHSLCVSRVDGLEQVVRRGVRHGRVVRARDAVEPRAQGIDRGVRHRIGVREESVDIARRLDRSGRHDKTPDATQERGYARVPTPGRHGVVASDELPLSARVRSAAVVVAFR